MPEAKANSSESTYLIPIIIRPYDPLEPLLHQHAEMNQLMLFMNNPEIGRTGVLLERQLNRRE